MTIPKIRSHESFGTEDNPVIFADPTPSYELIQEYETFESVEAAMQWFSQAAHAFGERTTTHEYEFVQFDDYVESKIEREWDSASKATAEELEAHGIIAKTATESNTYFKRTWKGDANPNTRLQQHDVMSTMVITDGLGRSGGIYTIEAKQHYPEHQHGETAPSVPGYAELTIDYLTEDETAYGHMISATATFGEKTEPMSEAATKRFLDLANNVKSVLASKLAIIDGEHHDQLKTFATTA